VNAIVAATAAGCIFVVDDDVSELEELLLFVFPPSCGINDHSDDVVCDDTGEEVKTG